MTWRFLERLLNEPKSKHRKIAKNKIRVSPDSHVNPAQQLKGQTTEDVADFTYLGSTIPLNRQATDDVKRRFHNRTTPTGNETTSISKPNSRFLKW